MTYIESLGPEQTMMVYKNIFLNFNLLNKYFIIF